MLGDDNLLCQSLPEFVMSAGAETIRRNIAIALGNIGDPASIPALATGLHSPVKAVRSYSAWALGAIGEGNASQELGLAASREEDSEVRREIQAALYATRKRSEDVSS